MTLPDRKPIFVIHGKGRRRGVGRESGGDLDTVASAGLLVAWIDAAVRSAQDRPAEPGRDFDFDFVNYQQGLRHLEIHPGCSIYLPDFPIDALAPRLVLRPVTDPAEPRVRNGLTVTLDRLNRTGRQDGIPTEWKDLASDLYAKAVAYRDRRSWREVAVLDACVRAATAAFPGRTASAPAAEEVRDWMVGPRGARWAEEIGAHLARPLKRSILDRLPQAATTARVTVDDGSRGDFGSRARIDYSPWGPVALAEALATARAAIEAVGVLRREGHRPEADLLLEWAEQGAALAGKGVDLLEESGPALPGGDETSDWTRALGDLREAIQSALRLPTEEPPEVSELLVHLCREEAGLPEPGIEILFRAEGAVQLGPGGEAGQESLDRTDEAGLARVTVTPDPDGAPWSIRASFDGLGFVRLGAPGSSFPEGDEGAAEPAEDPTQGPALSGRALEVARSLIRRDFEYLAERDVRIQRMDDHHPYSPGILAELEQLRTEGLMGSLVLSSLPRGQEQPPAKQLCGTDLIHKGLLQETPADREGFRRLRQLTHGLDLHLDIEPLAVELSKLIASKFSKTEMALGLARVESAQDMDRILLREGWLELVARYQEALDRVIHRVDATLISLELGQVEADPIPTERSGLGRRLRSLLGSSRGPDPEPMEGSRGSGLRICAALSPFCDPRLGEPPVNVASAVGHLTRDHRMDYFFYLYGSSLMTMRRVNQEATQLDLAILASRIGSPSDGGHPGASSCRPTANPRFPEDRFAKVRDRNLPDFAYYLGRRASELAGLPLTRVRTVEVQELPATEAVLRRLARAWVALSYPRPDGSSGTAVLVLSPPSSRPEPEPTFQRVLRRIRREIQPDWIGLCASSSSLVLRGEGAKPPPFDLAQMALSLGVEGDGGHPRSATCRPNLNPAFPWRAFRVVTPRNFLAYALYLVGRIEAETGMGPFLVLPSTPGDWEERLEEQTTGYRGRIREIQIPADRGTPLRLVAFLAPFVDRGQGGIPMGGATALGILARRAGRQGLPHYLMHLTGSLLHEFANLNDPDFRLDLQQLAQGGRADEGATHRRYAILKPRLPERFAKIRPPDLDPFLQVLAPALTQMAGQDPRKTPPKIRPLDLV